MHVAIISSSVRRGRESHKVALFLKRFLDSGRKAEVEILDLKEYDFPLFDERLIYMESPSENVADFTKRFNAADAIIIVSPVYNADYPAALKNVIDLYNKEWIGKPVLVVSVSAGPVPGIATVQKLQVLLMKLGARVSPAMYTVVSVSSAFDADGIPSDAALAEKYAAPAVNDLLGMV